MRRQVRNVVLAGVVTAISVAGDYALIHYMSPSANPSWLATLAAFLAFSPAFPAFIGSFFFGGGPDGNPSNPGIAVFLVTFVLWWFVIDWVIDWWTQRQTRSRPAGAPPP